MTDGRGRFQSTRLPTSHDNAANALQRTWRDLRDCTQNNTSTVRLRGLSLRPVRTQTKKSTAPHSACWVAGRRLLGRFTCDVSDATKRLPNKRFGSTMAVAFPAIASA